MTIAVAIKVNDGLVLAADSATTLGDVEPDTGVLRLTNIYNNANKVFNLHKQLPIGAMTWGQGNIGPSTISSLTKELRRRLMGADPNHGDWALDPTTYTVSAIAERAKQFIYDERYAAIVGGHPSGDAGSELGLFVCGYSAGAELPEGYLLTMSPNDGCAEPVHMFEGELAGAAWWGQPEAISRLVNGFTGYLPTALMNLGVPADQVASYAQALISQVRQGLVQPAMPIQDAIELADFLVDTTIKFVRFSPEPATVGGPIEVAAITQHEGFKWIKRKHYYSAELNPPWEG